MCRFNDVVCKTNIHVNDMVKVLLLMELQQLFPLQSRIDLDTHDKVSYHVVKGLGIQLLPVYLSILQLTCFTDS